MKSARKLKETVKEMLVKVGAGPEECRYQKCPCPDCVRNRRMTSEEKRAALAELMGMASGRYAIDNQDAMRGALREMIGLARGEFERQVLHLGYHIEARDEAALSALVERAEPVRVWREEREKEELKPLPRKPESELPAQPEIDWEAR